LEYMDLEENKPMTDIEIDHVFIGSCTNSRLRDLRKASAIVKGKKIKDSVKGIVVPGSALVKMQAEEEGHDEIFTAARFVWRQAGFISCLGIGDRLIPAGRTSASTSHCNFAGRQGNGARIRLVCPEMEAVAAIHGRYIDVRSFEGRVH